MSYFQKNVENVGATDGKVETKITLINGDKSQKFSQKMFELFCWEKTKRTCVTCLTKRKTNGNGKRYGKRKR